MMQPFTLHLKNICVLFELYTSYYLSIKHIHHKTLTCVIINIQCVHTTPHYGLGSSLGMLTYGQFLSPQVSCWWLQSHHLLMLLVHIIDAHLVAHL
jgi:hypothetical protein